MLPAFKGMDKAINLAVELIEVAFSLIDLQFQLSSPVFDELAEIGHIDGDIVHQATAELDLFLVHKGENLLGPDIEFLAYGIDFYLHYLKIIVGLSAVWKREVKARDGWGCLKPFGLV